jgi:hypothetical protein
MGSDVSRRGQGDDFYGLAFRQALILFKVSLCCLEMRVFQQCRCSVDAAQDEKESRLTTSVDSAAQPSSL